MAMKVKNARPGPQPRYDWDSVDWTQKDITIAKHLGCTRERVGQVRMAKGKPDAPHKWVSDRTIIAGEWFANNKHLSGTMNFRELAKATGYHRNTTYAIAKKRNFKIRGCGGELQRVRPWDDINWDLPAVDLTDIWKVKDPPSQRGGFRVTISRKYYKKPSAKWSRRFGQTPTDPEYYRALAQEKAKAREWFKTNQKGK